MYIDDPYWSLTAPTPILLPSGLNVTLTMQYAYASEGYINVGAGFLFSLLVMPTNLEEYMALNNVQSNSTQYTYSYTFPLRLDDSGVYEFTGKEHVYVMCMLSVCLRTYSTGHT